MRGPGGAPDDGAVLHFAADWLPASEVFVHDLVRHLARRGVVVAAGKLHNTERFPLPDVHSLTVIDDWARPAPLRRALVTAMLDRLVRRRRVAVVHAHHGYGLDRIAPTVRRHRLPFVVSFHGHDLTGYLRRHPDAYVDVADDVALVAVPSAFLIPHAVAAGFPETKVRVMPSGVDTAYFSPSPLPAGPPEVVFVGRFVAKKGIDTLASAWPEVQRAVPEARLRLLGYGELEADARAIPGNTDVVLSPDRSTVRDAIRRARAIVSPSRTAEDDAVETLLMVNLEAQASGRPVVTTRHGGIPEFVREDDTALVVPEADPDALAAALVRVLSDEELARSMAAAGPPWASRFDVRVTAARFDAAYDELVASRSRA